MKQFTVIGLIVAIGLAGLVAWWSFKEVPAEPIVLEQPPVAQHLEGSDDVAEQGGGEEIAVSDTVFWSEFNVQGSVRRVTLASDGTVVQYCDSMLAGCVGSAGTSTVMLSPEEYQTVITLLGSIESEAVDTPEAGVLYEATYRVEHTVDGVTMVHTASHPVIDDVSVILDRKLGL